MAILSNISTRMQTKRGRSKPVRAQKEQPSRKSRHLEREPLPVKTDVGTPPAQCSA
jgi:hypothetical protein